MYKLTNNLAHANSVTPPKYIATSFAGNFPHAVNAEWHLMEAGFEAVFFENNLETIALFNKYGALTETRKNLLTGEMPEKVAEAAANQGEVMNVIMVSKKNQIDYEIIYRDKHLNRFLLLLSSDGTILKNAQL